MKMVYSQIKVVAFLLLSALCFFSCEDTDRKNIKEYYFPLEELKDGKVYQYKVVDVENGRSFSRYIYSITVETDSGQYLINNSYDRTFFNDQLVTNEIVSNGVLVKSYQLMAVVPEKENQQITKANIIKPNAFPFSVKIDGGVTPMEMQFDDPTDTKEKIKFIRERKYLGDTIFTFKGVDLPAVIFAANEIRQFRHEDEGDFDNTTYATEIYAKGIGLISRKYKIGDVQLESILHDTFSMKKLEELAANYWSDNSEIIE